MQNLLYHATKFMPQRCALCRDPSATPWCQPCLASLPWVMNPCLRCGLNLPTDAPPLCGSCLQTPPPWQQAICALAYVWPVRAMLQAYKFQSRIDLATPFAHTLWLKSQWPQYATLTMPDAFVPIPLHRNRHVTRGFNQAERLAAALAKQFNRPLINNALIRTHNTRAQTGLNKIERRQNLKQAFTLRKPLPYKHIALVDDVLTTGATLSAATKPLKLSGVKHIDVWTAARVNAQAH